MRLGTRQECIGSLPRVSGVCQDGAREFARRRPRLAERLSRVAEKVVKSSDGDSPKGSGSSLGTHREIARRTPPNSPQECRRPLD
ncbi:hypothetical protein B296_00012449 [Ensete ventricosum]|uniref:Uncharacterized protein n=1 Tax=Ensete ventricosum TaxID=4639 RepID=A0A426ZZU9_ENSVE|nr:hypothetical protein B296_00012449 [Ensete ventricosum]